MMKEQKNKERENRRQRFMPNSKEEVKPQRKNSEGN
jgi:hypothetical protein